LQKTHKTTQKYVLFEGRSMTRQQGDFPKSMTPKLDVFHSKYKKIQSFLKHFAKEIIMHFHLFFIENKTIKSMILLKSPCWGAIERP